MNSKLFIPKKIKVGYQHRGDTYTNRLAYVIYYDTKGKLCKETSWKGWIHDEEVYAHKNNKTYFTKLGQYNQSIKENQDYEVYPALAPDDFENVPVEGFVLNKKVGGYSTGWNHRQTKCRVFDPRGFEFEITLENLLFILQVSNSYKGKGLEGQFVYAWFGKDIVLLPCDSEDYKESQIFTDMKSLKVSVKSLVEGYTYLHKNMNEMVFMGKQDFVHWPSWKKEFKVEKEFIFYDIKDDKFLPVKIPNIAKVNNESVYVDYAELVDKMHRTGLINSFDIVIEDKKLELPVVYEKSWYERGSHELVCPKCWIKTGEDVYTLFQVFAYFQPNERNWDYLQRRSMQEKYPRPATDEECRVKKSMVVDHYTLHKRRMYKIVGNNITHLPYEYESYGKDYTVEEMKAKICKDINLKFFDGTFKPIGE